MKESVKIPRENLKLEKILDFLNLAGILKRKKGESVRTLENVERGQELVVSLSRLRCKIIGGGWNHTNNIGVVNRFLTGNYTSQDLRIGDLVVKTWDDLEKVFEVLKIKQKSKSGEPEKGMAKIIRTPFRIKRNEALLDHDRKVISGEVPEYTFAPDDAVIDLVIDV